ncbi:hypothetical protein GDO78_012161 [Eleutherodactylus coqui]|uniref:Uncharacterized protein n=1 Tax=Eleutherodactylus coqui TaxID=57060 RepID=A0A8J6K9J8_ELECQ|nr:hypothetical protein GDO78_012161 [Eleutherodactylus coqui]
MESKGYQKGINAKKKILLNCCSLNNFYKMAFTVNPTVRNCTMFCDSSNQSCSVFKSFCLLIFFFMWLFIKKNTKAKLKTVNLVLSRCRFDSFKCCLKIS